jgi:hypothetical protein
MKTLIFLTVFLTSTSVLAQGHFPQCPNSTKDAALAEDMIRNVLGYMAPLSATLSGNVAFVPTTIRLSSKGGVLYFFYKRQNEISGTASVCQKGSDIWVTSSSKQFGQHTFILKKGDRNSLRVAKPGTPGSARLTAGN